MSSFSGIIICISFAALLGISIHRFMKYRDNRSFVVQIIVLLTSFVVMAAFFYDPEGPVGKGDGDGDIYFVIVLYLCMLLGMFAQYGHKRFSRPREERGDFDFGVFVAPVFASPIVFIPLLAALQNAEVDLQNLTIVKMMVFFVAFENGFFWKDYFDNRQKERKNAG